MIKQHKKKAVSIELNGGNKSHKSSEVIDITYNPELDKFSGDEFIPQKYKEAEIRLSKSVFPDSSSPFK
jgi:hypothetical protein